MVQNMVRSVKHLVCWISTKHGATGEAPGMLDLWEVPVDFDDEGMVNSTGILD